MTSVPVARHRTAIRRSEMSRPIRLAINDGLIKQDTLVFDYGCGHGGDVRNLNNLGILCIGWDPVYQPDVEHSAADVVNLGYVVNVIENPAERVSTLRKAWALTRRLLIVSARLTVDLKEDSQTPYGDGWITRSGTFQKFYEQYELRDWIDEVLSVSSVAAGPGVFYIFRDTELAQSFIASRFRRKAATPRQRYSNHIFEQYKMLLEPSIEFIALRGRLPDDSELDQAQLIRNEFGTLRHAFGVIQKVIGVDHLNQIREDRSQDILIYLALARFGDRPRFSQLSYDLQLDIRAFFVTYTRACSLADNLLFSVGNRKLIDEHCRRSCVGKLTPEALYVHVSALQCLSPILRVYEGCARALIGAVEGANILKLYRDKPQISYLSYPDFERNPHPALAASLTVNLQTFKLKYQEYINSENPPIIHRKETFLAPDHPLRPKFTRLTNQEEKKGLYENPSLIGTKRGWEQVIKERELRFVGHRLVRL